ELVNIIENELDKEVQYSHLNDYYGLNPSTGFLSAYTTVFKNIDSALKECLVPIPLFLQRAQIKADTIVKEPKNNFKDAIEHIVKRIEFGATISVAKTSIQVAIAKGITSELTGLLMKFVMKYYHNTGLNAQESQSISYSDVKISKSLSNLDNEQYSLDNISNLSEITNSEYYKPRDHLPKRLKSSTKENNNSCTLLLSSKIYSYCQEKGYNIRGCKKKKLTRKIASIDELLILLD
ncbi:22055_t:CDS:2, partial [Gigaspora margarita]